MAPAEILADVNVSYFNSNSPDRILHEVQTFASIFMINEYKPGLILAGSRVEMSTKLMPTTTGTHLLARGSFRLWIDGVEVLSGSEPKVSTEKFLFDPLKYETRTEYAMEAGRSYSIHIDMNGREPSFGEPTPYRLTLCFEEHYSDEEAIAAAVDVAAASDISIVFVGRNEQHESEGFDAESITLPDNQSAMIE